MTNINDTSYNANYDANVAQARAMATNLLDLVSFCNHESKEALVTRLDTGKKDGNLCCCELTNVVKGWMKTNYFLEQVVARGFDAVKFLDLAANIAKVNPNENLVDGQTYLRRADPSQPVKYGSGNTAPEKRKDRDDRKWMLRSAMGSRSIFQ